MSTSQLDAKSASTATASSSAIVGHAVGCVELYVLLSVVTEEVVDGPARLEDGAPVPGVLRAGRQLDLPNWEPRFPDARSGWIATAKALNESRDNHRVTKSEEAT